VYYRLFTVTNTQTLGTLSFTINHSGIAGDFSTVGSELNPSPSVNNVVFEFFVYRADTTDFGGYVNPFASANNPFNIENTGISGNVTATCNLVSRKVSNGDKIIVRMKFDSSYSNEITNISVDNI
jgi:hypothetical protein